MKTIQIDLDDKVKNKKVNITELLDTVRLQSNIIVGLNNKPLLSLESEVLGVILRHLSSITINTSFQKQR